MKNNLTIIIPAYNEEERIGKTLEDYCRFFNKTKIDYKLLVILNGCKDKTLDVIKKYKIKYPQIEYKNIKEAIGKGGAVIEGFKIANSNLIGFVDADNSTEVKAFYDLVKNLNGYDCVIASRWMKNSIVSPKQSFYRRFASRGFNSLVRILFGINVHDTQCGAKLFKKDSIKDVIYSIRTTRWAFDVDLLYQLKRRRYIINEIPTEWHEHEGSKLNVNKAIFEMFFALIRLRIIYSPFRFIIKVYDRMPEFLKIHHLLSK